MKPIDDVELPESSKSYLLPDNFQLGVLFRENQDMRSRLYDSNHQIESLKQVFESKQISIKAIEEEKNNRIAEFMSYIAEGEEISIETATIGKRKRASLRSVEYTE